MYNLDIRPALRFYFIIGALLGAVVFVTLSFLRNNDIESDKPIIPEKKIVIKNNKVDTIYIYKR